MKEGKIKELFSGIYLWILTRDDLTDAGKLTLSNMVSQLQDEIESNLIDPKNPRRE